MKRKKYLYGLMGLLSLLGFIGVFSDERSFLAFFAFVVDFEYFFVKSESCAFYCGMIAVAITSLVNFFVMDKTGNVALVNGFSVGWIISVIVHALLTAYYGFREKWGLNDD